ncbi:MAG: tRNA (adenosine(37)-N6)-threonylcarbamoyltransferase complex ATPase subunit type 1 TsaE [Candidatus Colwellbacteria bacterium CG10_big_fil_rev_8_21_14_0_10_42_22]|uniref:tRNA threonylcarbamoyladenosine biosynthesis protein TsaE n=1 Tax=Candidatus Colwellbacteria bacterium CG10_big_fil_rev_8_21_14_0_10_42_22 TaxID=1974540 RepID=A0A2H0VFW9_9BACT|nr:MAG: tRNA (adenosine(37)-N6)-threonylcarbamoyltransferase complex ATPase subunit type 1 TsaE [Candidatus Colwellbacteria bacterium CG10_big_fil_rev_8_21_14_0_10_42_22]
MNKDYLTKNTKETTQLAKELAEEILKRKSKSSVVLALVGDLGSGKTTFTQSFIKALGIKKRILSPTFVIQKRFKLPPSTSFANVYHIDAYRIKPVDLIGLGWIGAISNNNILVVEWADKIKQVLPKDAIWIRFKHGKGETERRITLNRR